MQRLNIPNVERASRKIIGNLGMNGSFRLGALVVFTANLGGKDRRTLDKVFIKRLIHDVGRIWTK